MLFCRDSFNPMGTRCEHIQYKWCRMQFYVICLMLHVLSGALVQPVHPLETCHGCINDNYFAGQTHASFCISLVLFIISTSLTILFVHFLLYKCCIIFLVLSARALCKFCCTWEPSHISIGTA